MAALVRRGAAAGLENTARISVAARDLPSRRIRGLSTWIEVSPPQSGSRKIHPTLLHVQRACRGECVLLVKVNPEDRCSRILHGLPVGQAGDEGKGCPDGFLSQVRHYSKPSKEGLLRGIETSSQ